MSTYPPRIFAERYGITVHDLYTEEESLVARRDRPEAHFFSWSGGFCTETKEVWFCQYPPRDVLCVARHFHEVAHCVTGSPVDPVDTVYENFILLQFERAVAKALVKRGVLYDAILEYQGTTELHTGETLDSSYTGMGHEWRTGFKYCRELGVLDRWNRPTWQWPQWPEHDIYGRWAEEVGLDLD